MFFQTFIREDCYCKLREEKEKISQDEDIWKTMEKGRKKREDKEERFEAKLAILSSVFTARGAFKIIFSF